MVKITDLLTEPSTWRGIINTLGGVAGILEVLKIHDTTYGLLIIMVTQILGGLIGTLTSDYKKTETKIDDVLHVAITALKDNKNNV